MKERPILFSAPMVRALLAGTKTQTRRLVKPRPHEDRSRLEVGHYNQTVIDFRGDEQPGAEKFGAWTQDGEQCWVCPYGQPGDRLWVREAWACVRIAQDHSGREINVYREGDTRTDYGGPWKPSIHMPRHASRITLEIIGIRVERLQDISEADALAEGVAAGVVASFARTAGVTRPAGFAYRDLWESINGPGSWDANPLVWVVEFRRVEGGAA